MQLHSHPLMTYKGRPIWPPQWIWISGPNNTVPLVGGIGTLENVQFSRVLTNSLFLTIGIGDGNRYMASLNFDDDHFAQRVLLVLHKHVGRTIKYIAEIDFA